MIVLLISSQMLLRWDTFWLPKFILDRDIGRRRCEKSVQALNPYASVIDRIVRPRLIFLTHRPFTSVIAVTYMLLTLVAPLFEVVPFGIPRSGQQ